MQQIQQQQVTTFKNTTPADPIQLKSEEFAQQFMSAPDYAPEILELTAKEISKLRKLVYHATYVRGQEGNRIASDQQIIDFVLTEIFTGQYWLALTGREQLALLERFMSAGWAKKNFDKYSRLFAKLHTAAWIGALDFCLGETIHRAGMPNEAFTVDDYWRRHNLWTYYPEP